jgi:hypothetical protein
MGVMTMHDVGVRYGSLADKVTSPRHDRFTPNNGRWTAHPSQHFGYVFITLNQLATE